MQRFCNKEGKLPITVSCSAKLFELVAFISHPLGSDAKPTKHNVINYQGNIRLLF